MNRSIEILKILRNGMQTMVSGEPTMQISYTRIFNFSERRVSLRMELSGEDAVPVPMGRVDVVEMSSNNGQSSCNCTLTELQTGATAKTCLATQGCRAKRERMREGI